MRESTSSPYRYCPLTQLCTASGLPSSRLYSAAAMVVVPMSTASPRPLRSPRCSAPALVSISIPADCAAGAAAAAPAFCARMQRAKGHFPNRHCPLHSGAGALLLLIRFPQLQNRRGRSGNAQTPAPGLCFSIEYVRLVFYASSSIAFSAAEAASLVYASAPMDWQKLSVTGAPPIMIFTWSRTPFFSA